MFRTIDDFQKQWAYESAKTLDVIRAIPSDRLAFGDGAHRSLGRLAWHLVETCVELPGGLGLKIDGPASGGVPEDVEVIRAAYEKVSAGVARAVAAWKDATLVEENEMYGEVWKKGYSLFALVVHQVHHRGQMTVLMRQAGLVVPEVYGPTREMWAMYGKPAPEV